MALNFRINRQKKDRYLYFRLSGDFDGASALELVRALESNSPKAEKIYIDTCGLSSVLAFGQDVFIKHCAISPIVSQKLIFHGAYGEMITPRGASYLYHRTEQSVMSH